MAKAQFEYDEQGNTFYYVCVSFYALVLLPATYYLWPRRNKSKDDAESKKCHCDPCLIKAARKNEKKTWQNYKPIVVSVILILGWAGLAVLSYKVIQLEVTHVDYDPYGILGLDAGATPKEIKKQYRKLSLLHHPDKGGDPVTFVKISKAYQALTDEDIRENWEKYGNPDGPGVTRFGIALPAWIIDKAYSYWVLGVYFLVFMVIMPSLVGVWWYKSIKYSADQVLLDTTQLFLYFFHKTPLMTIKRIVMVLGGSFEFDKEHNKDVVIRPTDEFEVPALLKELGTVGENNKERPLCFPYSIKARALLIAHLTRLQLPENTLEMDRKFILKKTPALIQEMISVVAQLVGHAQAGRIQRTPSVETIENIMKLSAMLVQATWDNKSPLLQLPHFSDEILRHCVSKKRHIKCCTDLANMSEEDRLSLLRSLDPAQYQNIMKVVCAMPNISMEVRVEVQDDEDKLTITAGAFVTVFVKLIRRSLGDVTNATVSFIENEKNDEMLNNDEKEEENAEGDENTNENAATAENEAKAGAAQLKIWERNKKKKGGKAPAKNKKKPTKPVPKKPTPAEAAAAVTTVNAPGTPEVRERKKKPKAEGNENESDEEGGDDGSESEDERNEVLNDMTKPTEEEEDLDFDDEISKKERILETKSKVTHPVHCPYFPEEKNEWWWLYLCDRKRKLLITAPTQVTSLVTEEEVELKFRAPVKTGMYSYQICLRSDSYLDCDQVKDVKIEVHEARQITSHPQWDFQTEDDGKEPEEHSDASDYTEGEIDDEDDGDN